MKLTSKDIKWADLRQEIDKDVLRDAISIVRECAISSIGGYDSMQDLNRGLDCLAANRHLDAPEKPAVNLDIGLVNAVNYYIGQGRLIVPESVSKCVKEMTGDIKEHSAWLAALNDMREELRQLKHVIAVQTESINDLESSNKGLQAEVDRIEGKL